VFKVEKWNSATSSKAPLDVAWFRIKGVLEKVCMVVSKVGVLLEVDQENSTKQEYIRVKIGCKGCDKGVCSC